MKIKINRFYYLLFYKLINFNNIIIKNIYYNNYIFNNLNLYSFKNYINLNLYNLNSINILYYYNYFFYLYKTFIFINYIWLYSIKFLNFYNLNISSLPTKKKIFTVLRSPHKDKKAREKFKINKIKKIISFPSFIGNNLFFIDILNEAVSIKYKVTISKNN